MSYFADSLNLNSWYLRITKEDLKQYVMDNPILPDSQIRIIYDSPFKSVAVVGDGSTLTRGLPIISWIVKLELSWFLWKTAKYFLVLHNR